MSNILALLIANLITSHCCESTQIQFDQQDVEKFIRKSLEQWNVPGVVAVIVHRNRVIFQHAYGFANLDGNPTPMRLDHAFPIASCSKAFTSALMAKLVDDKVINWNDHVQKHLPNFHVLRTTCRCTHYHGRFSNTSQWLRWHGS